LCRLVAVASHVVAAALEARRILLVSGERAPPEAVFGRRILRYRGVVVVPAVAVVARGAQHAVVVQGQDERDSYGGSRGARDGAARREREAAPVAQRDRIVRR